MALEVTIGGDGSLFIGEDKILKLSALDWDQPAVAGVYPPKDLTGKTVKFVVRSKDGSADPAILEKTANISGTFATSSNPQRAVVTLTDDDTNLFRLRDAPYRHAWKVMEDGAETVLAFGDFIPWLSTVR